MLGGRCRSGTPPPAAPPTLAMGTAAARLSTAPVASWRGLASRGGPRRRPVGGGSLLVVSCQGQPSFLITCSCGVCGHCGARAKPPCWGKLPVLLTCSSGVIGAAAKVSSSASSPTAVPSAVAVLEAAVLEAPRLPCCPCKAQSGSSSSSSSSSSKLRRLSSILVAAAVAEVPVARGLPPSLRSLGLPARPKASRGSAVADARAAAA
mmetsp:Transcript_98590/g.247074  ORF Transcript_98590/g.247074 Transcript_98590/m.247074 type:complete len:207 (-) Transcript_98590:365-985(-)